jgi:hypothetical protein
MRILISFFLIALCAGCASTESVIREFDENGKMTRETKSTQSYIRELTASTKNKTVILWENGWAAYLSASTATTEDPTPAVKMWAGKTSKGAIMVLPEQKNIKDIAAIIAATRENISVSAEGIKSSGE